MTVIVCMDERGGMSFCGRRVSRDRAVTARILKKTGGRALWMSLYSAKLFDPLPENARVSEGPLAAAPDGAVCFLETQPLGNAAARVGRIVRYLWNRRYPSDVRFDVDVTAAPWRLVSREDFAGHSHERVTEEVYER